MHWEAAHAIAPDTQNQTIFDALGLGQTDKPLLLLVENSDIEFGRSMKKIESVVLRDERINIADRFFRLVRIDRAEAGDALDRFVGRNPAPTFAAFTRTGARVGTTGPRVSPGKLLGLMGKGVRKDYRGVSMARTVSAVHKILNGLDKTDAALKTLDAARKRTDNRRRLTALATKEAELLVEMKVFSDKLAALWAEIGKHGKAADE